MRAAVGFATVAFGALLFGCADPGDMPPPGLPPNFRVTRPERGTSTLGSNVFADPAENGRYMGGSPGSTTGGSGAVEPLPRRRPPGSGTMIPPPGADAQPPLRRTTGETMSNIDNGAAISSNPNTAGGTGER